MTVPEKLNALRREMEKEQLSAYILPTGDFHGSEYEGAYFKTRAFMSGFTGSAGTLVVLREQAYLWTDGRYFIQAEVQLEGSTIARMPMGQPGIPSVTEFLAKELSGGSRIGFDARMVSCAFVEELEEAVKKQEKAPFRFFGEVDYVDKLWENRPPMSKKPVWEPEAAYMGLTRSQKLEKVRQRLKEEKGTHLLLTALEEIAWLVNLRGGDIAYTPVFLGYMLLSQKEAALCLHREILSPALEKALQEDGIRIFSYEAIEGLLKGLPQGSLLWADRKKLNYHLSCSIPHGVTRLNLPSPVERMKAVKTPAEMEALRIAHRKDGVAVTRFLRWLKEQVKKEPVTELEAAKKLLELRKAADSFLNQSFAPILAYKEHGAIVHYSPEEKTDKPMGPWGLCLADTGAHYREGTTDITRTIALGPLTREEKEMFTLVLKGHLALGQAQFPEGVSGQNLDYLARAPLWEKGLDFRHGTGHGVGFLLSVHEGPQRISWNIRKGEEAIPLQEGMVVSNEPGFYSSGKFGIRHENLLLCRKGKKTEYGQFLYFEPLTMVPFDLDAVDPEALTRQEADALNAYHRKVYETLAPHLEEAERQWLANATRPIEIIG